MLDPDLKYSADTMFSRRKNMIRASMDSLCEVQTKLLFDRTRDSLLDMELERIMELSQKNNVR